MKYDTNVYHQDLKGTFWVRNKHDWWYGYNKDLEFCFEFHDKFRATSSYGEEYCVISLYYLTLHNAFYSFFRNPTDVEIIAPPTQNKPLCLDVGLSKQQLNSIVPILECKLVTRR